MKPSKTILILFSIILLGGVVYLLARSNPSPVADQDMPVGTPEATPTLPVAELDDVIAKLTHLQQVNQSFLSQAGWHHYEEKTWDVGQVDREESEEAPYSTEGMFPPTQILEHWYRIIDDEGTFGPGSFTVISDEVGNPVQVVVSDSQGNGGNITLMERELTEFFENDPVFEASIVAPETIQSSLGDIIDGFEGVRWLDTEVKADYVSNHGVEEYQIQIQTAVVNEPYDFPGIPEPVNAFITFYRIDPETGIVLELMEDGVGLSGEVYKMFSQITLVTEIVDEMPEDVQQRYEAALARYKELAEEAGEVK